MMTSSKPEFENPKNRDPDFNESTGQIANPIDLSSDPDYSKLLEHYQKAEFIECQELLDNLETRYPGHPELLKFKADLQMKFSMKNMAVSIKKGERRNKTKATLNLGVFAIIGTLVLMMAFFFSYFYRTEDLSVKQSQEKTALLVSLDDQAAQLLRVGKPQPAAEIIEKMRSIDPEFKNLAELTTRTGLLLRLETKYNTALGLTSDNKIKEALVIFKEIEAEKSGLWDVNQQISSIETSIEVAKYVDEGKAAYLVKNWDSVINAYEYALKLDSKLDDALMKEQLLTAYLNKIIGMLENENTTSENIANAEEYYRKATAMIPQSKVYASERRTLQDISNNLLELKYTQMAKTLLEDKNQNTTSIAKAVSYINKAVMIDPNNNALQMDLKNAQSYQLAFQDFIEMNWEQAIINFSQILTMDSGYANGNASLLLFEAYYTVGKKYFSAGLYLDALKNLEQAELLAWDDKDNLMKLFKIQVLLGDTLGKIYDYKNAVSYYQYALDAIQVNSRLENFPAISKKLDEARVLAANEHYQNALTAFQEGLQGIDVIYSTPKLEISRETCLAFFASENSSIMDAILEANNLPMNMVITFRQNLKVPMIKK